MPTICLKGRPSTQNSNDKHDYHIENWNSNDANPNNRGNKKH